MRHGWGCGWSSVISLHASTRYCLACSDDGPHVSADTCMSPSVQRPESKLLERHQIPCDVRQDRQRKIRCQGVVRGGCSLGSNQCTGSMMKTEPRYMTPPCPGTAAQPHPDRKKPAFCVIGERYQRKSIKSWAILFKVKC